MRLNNSRFKILLTHALGFTFFYPYNNLIIDCPVRRNDIRGLSYHV